MKVQDGLFEEPASVPDLSVYGFARGRRSIAAYVSRVFGARYHRETPANDQT